ncbi:MAG: sulfite exporter TauE/SafE family protein [Acidiferrobacter sp.]
MRGDDARRWVIPHVADVVAGPGRHDYDVAAPARSAIDAQGGTVLTALGIYVVVGAAIGLLAGLFGVGGGGVLVPSFLWLFARANIPLAVRMHLALGTSLACIVFTSLASIRAQQKRHAIDWPLVRALAPTVLVGSLISGYAAGGVAPGILKAFFGVFLAVISVQMLMHWQPAAHWRVPGRAGLGLAGFVIGSLSALLGIGGGSLTVPFLAACRVDMKRAIAVSATLGFPIALFGSLGFVLTGLARPGLPPLTVGFVYLPALIGVTVASIVAAPQGVALSHALPTQRLKPLFGLLLLAIAVRMLWTL